MHYKNNNLHCDFSFLLPCSAVRISKLLCRYGSESVSSHSNIFLVLFDRALVLKIELIFFVYKIIYLLYIILLWLRRRSLGIIWRRSTIRCIRITRRWRLSIILLLMWEIRIIRRWRLSIILLLIWIS